MEISPSTLGWIAALVALYLFGFFEGRAKGYKKRKKEEEQEKQNQPAPQPEIVTQTVTETVTVKVDDPGLLRVKNEDGAYTLDLDGRRVDPVALPPEQRKRLIEILNIMRPWLEGRAAPPPSAATGQTPPAPATETRQGVPFRPAPSASLGSPAPAPPPPPAGPPAPVAETRQVAPVQPPPASPATPPPAPSKPAATAKDDRPAPAPKSIVGQIDAILQARLIGTPLEKYAIHLSESPQGGANVFVGSNRYDTVDEVPDPEIKAAIRAATKEWEDKYTPGL